jgi:hypothetical protein
MRYVYLGNNTLICNDRNEVVGIYTPLIPEHQRRAQTNRMAPSARFQTTDEYLQVREVERLYKANRRSN